MIKFNKGVVMRLSEINKRLTEINQQQKKGDIIFTY
jgi:hypothetical protein